jgi:hypothetical protein
MVNGPTVADLELPNASLMGSTIQTTINLPPGTPANPAIETVTIDIAGYTFDLTGTAMNDVNTLTNSIEMFTAPGAPAVNVTDQDSIIALLNYDGIVPEYARGYFGMEDVSVDETTELDFFGNIIAGILDLDQVTVKMKISNGVGVDAQAFINSLNSINNRTGSSVGLVHSVMNGPVNITRGVDLGNGFVASYQEIELNNGNSNIDQFVENLPDALEYEIDLAINPLGNISNGNDFLYYDSEMRIDLETEIPLCVIADALTLQDTSVVNLPGSSQSPGLQYGTLNIFVNNGFPLDAEFFLEIYSNGISYANIPVSPGVSSAAIDGSGNVIAPTATQLLAELSPEHVDLLYEHKQVRFTVAFDTPALGGQHIKIKDTHFMDIQVTADFNYVVNSDG